MASKNIELKVGLLVLFGAAVLVFALYLAKGYRYGEKFYSLSVVFPEVGALATGDPIAVSGVNKGKVKKLRLFEGEVMADLEISTDVTLKEDATFTIKNIGLMGERFVSISPGRSAASLDLSRPARGGFDAGIPEVMGMMGEVIANLNDLVNLLEQTAISPTTLDRFSKTVENLQKVTAQLESSARRDLPKIDRSVNDFELLAHNLREGTDRNLPYVDSAARNLDDAGRRLMAFIGEMEEASARLNRFAGDLEQSEGSLRLFMEDRRLYDDLRTAAQNLDSLVDDVRANPRKYINFTVEIF